MPEETLLSAAIEAVKTFRLDEPSGMISAKTIRAINILDSQIRLELNLRRRADEEDDQE